jgi:hypothetical protein
VQHCALHRVRETDGTQLEICYDVPVMMTRLAKSKSAKRRRGPRDRRPQGDLSGAVLVAALQASPYRDLDIEPKRSRLHVRDVGL